MYYFLILIFQKKSDHGSGVFLGLLKAAFYSIFVAVITLVINKLIKVRFHILSYKVTHKLKIHYCETNYNI